MLRIYGDFETYWDDDYSLTKMSPIEYILDQRFETIGCAVAVNDKPSVWLSGDKMKEFLDHVNEPYMFISHNSLFDACILSYRYDIHPTLITDTMNMARAILTPYLPQGKVRLEVVADYLKLGRKGKTVLKTKGLRRKDLEARPALFKEFKEYALNDNDLCRGIYKKLAPKFPAKEHIIMDMVNKTTTIMQLRLNLEHLNNHLVEVKAAKQKLLDQINFTVEDLMSNDKFAAALTSYGIDPPTKVSLLTGKETWAFAKSDWEFMELLEHENPDVQALVAARIGHKSTLEETRTRRFISIANATINSYGEAMVPMALVFSGAHTHRFSGGWKLNLQNLPARKSRLLRNSIIAPKGYVILAVDASQIEARLVAWFAKQTNLLKGFEQGRDVYKEFACTIFNTSIENVSKIQRFIAKECILGLGFQLGVIKLFNTIQTKAKDQNLEVYMEMEDAEKWVDVYRNKHNNIKKYWGFLRDLLPLLADGGMEGLLRDCCDVKHQEIVLPSGLSLFYHNLKLNEETEEWWFEYGGRKKKLYGGKLLENLVQAFDRIVVMDAALRIFLRTGIRMAHNVHDEIVYVVKEDEVEALKIVALEEMTRRPTWGPDLPLAAEAKIGYSFGDMQ